ncbi:MAG: glutamate--tRNA ligase, partial [Candidatus Diapherotrites archaeon]|nr:glutamate--tRNA ligase [Candidatus Diapherotrites archaeon]
MNVSEVKENAFRYGVKNAFLHEGKADIGAIIGKLKALDKELNIKNVMPEVIETVKEINALPFSEIEKKFHEFEGSYELKVQEKKEGLPELDWAEKEPVVTRYAPNPNGPFHLGNARAAIVSYEYARKYNGKFILRFDDTDPKVKKSMSNAEEIFNRDLNWLGIKVDETFFASDRIEIYYEHMKKIIDLDKAYVCTCDSEEWRKLITEKTACPCRELDKKEQRKRFDKMLSHEFKEGQAVLRIKTDLNHVDPSIRDWWAAKIVDWPNHPRVKQKYILWPSYNFASAIDDHLLGVTLIIRGQEHEQNMTKQKYLYEFFGWVYPHAVHFGRIKLGEMVLSTSKISKGIEEGLYTGWDDVRLGTICALRKRGFEPEALKHAILDLGINTNDATIEMNKLADLNKKIIEPKAKRATFIANPVQLEVNYCKEKEIEKYGQKYLLKANEKFMVE